MTTNDEWKQKIHDKLNTSDYTIHALNNDGIVVKIKNCKCPECKFEQRAFYELPTDATRYEFCKHEHDCVPHRL